MLAGTMKVEGVSGDIEDSNFAVGIINGSKTDKGFKTGLGIEYNAYPNATVLPLFFDIRAETTDKENSAFMFTDIGYSLCWIKGMKGINGDGLFLSPGLGVKISTATLEAAYRMQWSSLYSVYDNYKYRDSEELKCRYDYLTLMLGFLF